MLPSRVASKVISSKHKQLVDDFLHTANNAPSIVRKQFLDANQIQRLSLTLDRAELYRGVKALQDEFPLIGTPVPPGYHLAYFTPAALPGDLGRDGTDMSYSPAEPFTRRMWAGGSIIWEKGNSLRIGDVAVETTKLVSAVPKITKAGEEMIVVSVEKTFENVKGLALVDKRDWIFRTKLLGPPPSHHYQETIAKDDALLPLPKFQQKSRDFMQTAASLFRFSALTFNAHMIHYSRPWCREVEGHRDIVVHGPLNLINMLDFWRDVQADDFTIPKSISYRAIAPFYAEQKYRALLESGVDTTSIKLWGHDEEGDVKVGMLGDVAN